MAAIRVAAIRVAAERVTAVIVNEVEVRQGSWQSQSVTNILYAALLFI